VQRQDLNVHLSNFFSLVPEGDAGREALIVLAANSSSFQQLLREWLWEQDLGLDQILQLKTYFTLGYMDLGKLFGLERREVAQQLRSRRLEVLGSYPRIDQGDFSDGPAGLSCFMVEQQLSQWLDCEWEELSSLAPIRKHLEFCPACSHRLQSYRELHRNLLEKRASPSAISEREWIATLLKYKRVRRKKVFKWLAILATLAAILILFVWIIQQQPERMPNIYEYQDF